MYLKAIEEGKKFVIKDEDSKVYKRSSVNARVFAVYKKIIIYEYVTEKK